MKSIVSIFKRNYSINETTEMVDSDMAYCKVEFKTIKSEGSEFIDISDMCFTDNKFEFIEKNFKLLIKHNYDGFIIKKNVEIMKFHNKNYKYGYLYNGLLIINMFKEYIVHCDATSLLNSIIGNYVLTTGITKSSGSISVRINARSSQYGDGSITTYPQPHTPNSSLLLVHEVNYRGLAIERAIVKCLRYFRVPSINVVVLIQIDDRDPLDGNLFKSVAIVFERRVSMINPTSIISFGSQQLSPADVNRYMTLFHNISLLTGYLNNNNINNIENNPIYMITIPAQSLFYQYNPFPIGVGDLTIDLFRIKEIMDISPNFSSSF